MKIIATILLATLPFAAPASQMEFCMHSAGTAHDTQIKRQHRVYDYVDVQSFVSARHAQLEQQQLAPETHAMVREQYRYIAEQVYTRSTILNPMGMFHQVYRDCMLKNDWDYQNFSE